MEKSEMILKRIYILLALGGLFVILVEAFGMAVDNTSYWVWWVANGFHTIGGVFAFIFCRAVFLYVKTRYKIIMPFGFEILLFVGGALILGVFWEWYELIIDRYRLFVLGIPSVAGYADNIGDLAFDTIGAALVGVYIWHKNKKRRNDASN